MRDQKSRERLSSSTRRRDLPYIAFLVFSLVLVYGQVTAYSFGFYDDYGLLERARNESIWTSLSGVIDAAGGRPLQTLFTALTFAPINSVDELKYVRALTVIGIVACGVATYCWLRLRRFSRPVASLAATLVFLTPPFQIYTAWAVTAAYPFALLAGGLAGFLSLRILDSTSVRGIGVRAAISLGLALVALATYQPAGMAFVAVALLDVLADLPVPRTLARRAGSAASVFIAATLGALALARIGKGSMSTEREALTTDIADKVHWFTREAVVNAVDIWHLPGSPRLAAIVLVTISVGLLLHAASAGWARSVAWMAFPLGLVLVYLPNLTTVDNWAAYRTLAALTPFIVVSAVIAGRGYLRGSRALLGANDVAIRCTRILAISGLAMFTLAAAAHAQKQLAQTMLAPQAAEVRALRASLSDAIDAGFKKVTIIPPEWSEGSSPLVVYDEFGLPSTSVPAALDPLAAALLRERGAFDTVKVTMNTCEAVPEGRRSRVIDLRSLLAPERFSARNCTTPDLS